jgi:hypothetical protein
MTGPTYSARDERRNLWNRRPMIEIVRSAWPLGNDGLGQLGYNAAALTLETSLGRHF